MGGPKKKTIELKAIDTEVLWAVILFPGSTLTKICNHISKSYYYVSQSALKLKSIGLLTVETKPKEECQYYPIRSLRLKKNKIYRGAKLIAQVTTVSASSNGNSLITSEVMITILRTLGRNQMDIKSISQKTRLHRGRASMLLRQLADIGYVELAAESTIGRRGSSKRSVKMFQRTIDGDQYLLEYQEGD